MVRVKVKRARKNGLPLPAYQTDGAACFDLSADIRADGQNEWALLPGGLLWVKTGWCFEVPPGYEMQVRGRSGLAFRSDVIAHHFGTVDCDYRGEVLVGLENRGGETFRIAHGMRIAQAKIAPVPRVVIEEVDALSETARGCRGFGSTGVEAVPTPARCPYCHEMHSRLTSCWSLP